MDPINEPDAPEDDPTGGNGPGPMPGEPDPTAPYGRDPDGTLLDRNGKKAPYGLARSGLRKRNKPGSDKPRRPTASRPSPPSGRTIAGRRAKAVAELMELPAAGCIGIGIQRNDYRLIAQASTFQDTGPALGKALAELAEDNARLGQLLDRATEGGPYMALGLVVVGFVAQTARNFDRLPGELAAMLGGKNDPQETAMATLQGLGIPVNVQDEGAPANGQYAGT